MNTPVPIRPRQKQSTGAVIGVVVLFGLALLGLVEAAVLLTLFLTGQIG